MGLGGGAGVAMGAGLETVVEFAAEIFTAISPSKKLAKISYAQYRFTIAQTCLGVF